jgi:hypothetical protein
LFYDSEFKEEFPNIGNGNLLLNASMHSNTPEYIIDPILNIGAYDFK